MYLVTNITVVIVKNVFVMFINMLKYNESLQEQNSEYILYLIISEKMYMLKNNESVQ